MLHVWTWNLHVGRHCLSQLEELLSLDEWQRVKRLSSQRLVRRFIVRRGMLRRIIGHYLDLPPTDIKFTYNPHGKPFLAPELSSDLQFNLSDSGELAALALCLGQPVGIDIERQRPVQLAGVLESYGLTPLEVEKLKHLAVPERSSDFFQYWTRLEALAKAEGTGLQMQTGKFQMDDFAGHLPPASNAAVTLRKNGFHLHQLALPGGYVGSLAARLKEPRIVYCSPDKR